MEISHALQGWKESLSVREGPYTVRRGKRPAYGLLESKTPKLVPSEEAQ